VNLPHGPVTSIAPAAVTNHEQPDYWPRCPIPVIRVVRNPPASVLAVAVCAMIKRSLTPIPSPRIQAN
jgi:hypothetical protein